MVVDIMGIILGVIGAIVAIGLMLILMWKVFTTIHDRREYARFEKEQRLAKWDAVSKEEARLENSWSHSQNPGLYVQGWAKIPFPGCDNFPGNFQQNSPNQGWDSTVS